jgi:Outer membrane protein beta-barrel domain/Bacterial SH3 domain
MRQRLPLATLLILVSMGGQALGAEEPNHADAPRYVRVTVADAYLELHTGPGRGYPIFRVVGRADAVDILKRRTDWFEVRDDKGKVGWAERSQMEHTLLADGRPLRLEDLSKRDYDASPWEAGFQTGNFGGGNVNSAYVGYSFNDYLSSELGLSQALGSSSTDVFATIGLTHTFRPDWRFAPFVDLGTGYVHIVPRATIVAPPDRNEQLAYWGAGIKIHLARRLMFRADYRSYVIFTKSAQNEDRNEWKVGFAFFF